VVEIEFFLADEPPDGLGQREEIGGVAPVRRHLMLNRARVGAIIMLGAAAALAVTASFQRVYTVEASAGDQRSSYWVDGWGRFRDDDGASVPPSLHEARWALALCVCAGCFVALAVAAAVLPALAARVSPRAVSAVAGATIGLVGLLAGLLVAAGLQISAVVDRLQASSVLEGGPRPNYDLRLGGFLWFGLAGLVAGLLSIAATLHLRRA
jgi:hypothetical protein